MFFFIYMCNIHTGYNSVWNNVMPCIIFRKKNQVAFTKNIMPNKLRIITHLVTKPTKKPFSLLNHVKEVKENIRNGNVMHI